MDEAKTRDAIVGAFLGPPPVALVGPFWSLAVFWGVVELLEGTGL